MRRFAFGTEIVLRNLRLGRVRYAEPALVVHDDETEVAVFRPSGTPIKVPRSFHLCAEHAKREAASRQEVSTGEWEVTDAQWAGSHVVGLARPEEWFSTWLFFDEDGVFGGYYVNFERPWARTPMGFDTSDLCLDLMVGVDLQPTWKDEQDFHERVEGGLITSEEATEVTAARDIVLHRLERRLRPFDGEVLNWEPDPSWRPPHLRAGWDAV